MKQIDGPLLALLNADAFFIRYFSAQGFAADNFMKTAFEAMRIGISLFLLLFAFGSYPDTLQRQEHFCEGGYQCHIRT